MNRCHDNPLITVKDVKPSQPGFHVTGIFNCGVCRCGGEILLVCRVSESAGTDEDSVRIPIMVQRKTGRVMDVLSIKKSEHPELDFSDSRAVRDRDGVIVNLTSFSHLRLAHSSDGIHFRVDEKPMILPQSEEESLGMEDPRVTQIGSTYYITYTAVSPQGPAAALLATEDFRSFRRFGVILAPENKDTVIFPEKISGRFLALNRPVSSEFGSPAIWICESPDLIHWGRQKYLCGTRAGWENGRIGSGAVPFRTEKGWVEFYHASDRQNRYCVGAVLLDAEDPWKILARTEKPILQPEAPYETDGFFSDTVFTCGCFREGNCIALYYGAADDKICRADFTMSEINSALGIE